MFVKRDVFNYSKFINESNGAAPQCVHSLIEAQALKTPEKTAVQFNEQYLTYKELNARANQLARYLIQLGVGSEVLVGINVERSLEMVVALLATLKAGGAYVPLDPAYNSERLAHMLKDAQISVLLTQQKLVSQIPQPVNAQVVCLDDHWRNISLHSSENLTQPVTGKDLAYIIYTSGSTGKPKGVMIPHSCLSSFTQTIISEFEITPKDRVLQFASINFDAAVEEIYPCLCAGGTLVLRSNAILLNAQDFMQSCHSLQLTVLDLPTAYWHQLAAELKDSNINLPSALRLVIIGGERALPELVRYWQEYVNKSSNGDRLQLINTYGPTETTVSATFYRVPTTHSSQVPIGRPLPGVTAYILDENLQPVAVGVEGEIYIGGSNVGRGYLHNPELTASKFIPDPFGNSEARLYKTGDLARPQADGNIEYVGRIDHQVKIRGFRIELGEIETTLIQYSSVREVVVVAAVYGIFDKRLVAYIVPQPSQALTLRELRDFLSSKLPEYMVPSSFVILDALPLTPNNKIDIRALPSPDKSNLNLDEEFVDSRNEIEKKLITIWEKLLGVQPIGIQDNFFSLGGNSLLATSLVTEVKKEFRKTLNPAILFEAPTIEQFSSILIQEQTPASSTIKIHTSGIKTPLFIIGNSFLYQHLLNNLNTDQPVYIIEESLGKAPEMAKRCIQAIREIQPNGAYKLLGHSYEGLVAYEIAQQLLADNQTIDLLGLIDTATPELEIKVDKISLLQKINQRIRINARNSAKENLSFIKERLKHRLSESIKPLMPLIDQLTNEYIPQPYPGQLTIFSATYEPYGLEDSSLGWGELAAGTKVYKIPSSHRSILLKPNNAKILANVLNLHV